MDSTILAAVIGGIATITVAVISPFITNKFQEKKRSKYVPSAPSPRQNSLYGTWHGVMKQVVGIDKVLNQHTLTIVFESGTKPISGSMKIVFKVADDEILIGKNNSIEGKVINTIYDGRFLKTDYVNKDNDAIHFGSIYGKLSSNGKEIHGKFLGYGLVSEQFVSGTIELKIAG